MASLEIEGRIARKFPKQEGQGARGSWIKQDFLLEFMDGNFSTQVCFTSFGSDKVAELDRYQVSDEVKVSFNLRGREYNGKWYNDVRVWRISPVSQAAPAAHQAPAMGQGAQMVTDPNGQAFRQAPSAQQMPPAPSLEDMPFGDDATSDNDLPF
ncbi:MAG: DUF3127 domain-containing protein [Bacteroidales bacterium]|nr:DUF3127 domain-containing protein [Bacteroidales bacterium]